MTVNKVAVVTMKFLFHMCDCKVDNEAGTGDFLLMLGTLHMYGQVHMQSHLSPGMDC